MVIVFPDDMKMSPPTWIPIRSYIYMYMYTNKPNARIVTVHSYGRS